MSTPLGTNPEDDIKNLLGNIHPMPPTDGEITNRRINESNEILKGISEKMDTIIDLLRDLVNK